MKALYDWRMSLPKPTLAEAAKLLGVSEAQMSRYEAGRRRIAPERAIEFERVTGIPRAVLRPDVFGPVNTENTV